MYRYQIGPYILALRVAVDRDDDVVVSLLKRNAAAAANSGVYSYIFRHIGREMYRPAYCYKEPNTLR
jgi:hypothetical protein